MPFVPSNTANYNGVPQTTEYKLLLCTYYTIIHLHTVLVKMGNFFCVLYILAIKNLSYCCKMFFSGLAKFLNKIRQTSFAVVETKNFFYGCKNSGVGRPGYDASKIAQ